LFFKRCFSFNIRSYINYFLKINMFIFFKYGAYIEYFRIFKYNEYINSNFQLHYKFKLITIIKKLHVMLFDYEHLCCFSQENLCFLDDLMSFLQSTG